MPSPLLAVEYGDVGTCHNAAFSAPCALIEAHRERFVGPHTYARVEEVSEARKAIDIAQKSAALEGHERVGELASLLSGIPNLKKGFGVDHHMFVPRVGQYANVRNVVVSGQAAFPR